MSALGFCTDCGEWTLVHKDRCSCGSGRVAMPPARYRILAPGQLDDETQAAEREKVATTMLRNSIATGHGDTIDDLLAELEAHLKSQRNEVLETAARVADVVAATIPKSGPYAKLIASAMGQAGRSIAANIRALKNRGRP